MKKVRKIFAGLKRICSFVVETNRNTMTTTYINRNFTIVIQPKEAEKFGKRRFAVGAGRLAEYIGEENAKNCFEKADKITKDKIRFKFRVQGIVDFYLK